MLDKTGKLGKINRMAYTKCKQESLLDQQYISHYLEKNTKAVNFIKNLGIDPKGITLAEWERSGAAGFFNLLLYKSPEIILRIHLYPGKVEDCYPHCHATELNSFVLKGKITQNIFNLDVETLGCTYECVYKGSQSYL